MELSMQKHLLSLFATGHPHNEMSKMLECKYCGDRFKKAEKEYVRLYKTYPQKFIRQQPEVNDPKTDEMEQKLDDRIKMDSLYNKHLKTLAMGTPEDKLKEVKRYWSGFYERHTGDSIKKYL